MWFSLRFRRGRLGKPGRNPLPARPCSGCQWTSGLVPPRPGGRVRAGIAKRHRALTRARGEVDPGRRSLRSTAGIGLGRAHDADQRHPREKAAGDHSLHEESLRSAAGLRCEAEQRAARSARRNCVPGEARPQLRRLAACRRDPSITPQISTVTATFTVASTNPSAHGDCFIMYLC